MRQLVLGFVLTGLCATTAWGQSSATSSLLVVASGKAQRGFLCSLQPGMAMALRFVPVAGRSAVGSLTLPFLPFGRRDTAQVPVRVRLANVTASGGPADDDLLPAPVVLAPEALQAQAGRPLVLAWAAGQVPVPASGFFVVLEGLGRFPDEYVTDVVRPWAYSYNAAYQIARRQHPEEPSRLLNRLSIALLPEGRPSAAVSGCWFRGGSQPDWQPIAPGRNYFVPVVEVGLW